MDYVYDLKLFIDLIKEENNEIPLILLGHSMGGVIAMKYALAYSEDLKRSHSFFARVCPLQWKFPDGKKRSSGILSRYASRLTQPTRLDSEYLSHDPDVVEAYENDRFGPRQVSARWFTEFTKACEECLNRALGAADAAIGVSRQRRQNRRLSRQRKNFQQCVIAQQRAVISSTVSIMKP